MINDKPRTMRLRISCLILHNCEAVETCSPIFDVNISVHDGSNLSWIVTNTSQLPAAVKCTEESVVAPNVCSLGYSAPIDTLNRIKSVTNTTLL